MSNPKELSEKLRTLHARSEAAAQALVTYSRSLAHALRDAGREHTAKELDRLLFEYDAAVQEEVDLVRSDLDGFVDLFRGPR